MKPARAEMRSSMTLEPKFWATEHIMEESCGKVPSVAAIPPHKSEEEYDLADVTTLTARAGHGAGQESGWNWRDRGAGREVEKNMRRDCRVDAGEGGASAMWIPMQEVLT
jgi:hypothetical protein